MLTIRPPDTSIKGRTLMYGPYSSAEATRRYIHLAFRDAHTAIDLTAAHGGFWKPPVPPALAITTNNLDPTSRADLHLDFTDTGLPDESYDLAVYDPPHLADLGADSIMGKRFGSASGSAGLDALVTAGVREAWRISRVGILVKLADSSHGGEFLQLSRWVLDQFDAQPYFVAHTTRPPLEDGKWKVQRVPRSNGAVYLIWRKAGHEHRDFDALYERQEERKARQLAADEARLSQRRQCVMCRGLIPESRRSDAQVCSGPCLDRAYRMRMKGAPLRKYARRENGGTDAGSEATDRGRSDAVHETGIREGLRSEGASQGEPGRLLRRLRSGSPGAGQQEFIPPGGAGLTNVAGAL